MSDDRIWAEAVAKEAGTVRRYVYPSNPGLGTVEVRQAPAPRRPYFGTCARRVPGLWFFRVVGFGLHCKDTRRHPLIFSERCGWPWAQRWAVMIGGWRLRILHPWG